METSISSAPPMFEMRHELTLGQLQIPDIGAAFDRGCAFYRQFGPLNS